MLNFLFQHIKFFSELSSPGNLLKAFRKLCVLFKHILKKFLIQRQILRHL